MGTQNKTNNFNKTKADTLYQPIFTTEQAAVINGSNADSLHTHDLSSKAAANIITFAANETEETAAFDAGAKIVIRTDLL